MNDFLAVGLRNKLRLNPRCRWAGNISYPVLENMLAESSAFAEAISARQGKSASPQHTDRINDLPAPDFRIKQSLIGMVELWIESQVKAAAPPTALAFSPELRRHFLGMPKLHWAANLQGLTLCALLGHIGDFAHQRTPEEIPDFEIDPALNARAKSALREISKIFHPSSYQEDRLSVPNRIPADLFRHSAVALTIFRFRESTACERYDAEAAANLAIRKCVSEATIPAHEHAMKEFGTLYATTAVRDNHPLPAVDDLAIPVSAIFDRVNAAYMDHQAESDEQIINRIADQIYWLTIVVKITPSEEQTLIAKGDAEIRPDDFDTDPFARYSRCGIVFD